VAVTITSANLVMGPCTGYAGAFGATEPDVDNFSTPASGSWSGLGGTLGGVTVEIQQEFKALEVDQLDQEVGARRVKFGATVKIPMTELTLENLCRAFNIETTDIASASGYRKLALTGRDPGTAPNYQALLLYGYGPSGYTRKSILRKCLATSAVATEQTKDGQQVWEVEFNNYWVSPTTDSIDVYDEVPV
jgi:hypothetical protein